jgi:hypothetical protein
VFSLSCSWEERWILYSFLRLLLTGGKGVDLVIRGNLVLNIPQTCNGNTLGFTFTVSPTDTARDKKHPHHVQGNETDRAPSPCPCAAAYQRKPRTRSTSPCSAAGWPAGDHRRMHETREPETRRKHAASGGADPATAAGPDRVSSGLECTPGISLTSLQS